MPLQKQIKVTEWLLFSVWSKDMKIARVLYPVHVLGPGERLAIWTYGCSHACKGCTNPELWNPKNPVETTKEQVQKLLENISDRGMIEGVTITGGDPFRYPDSLTELIDIVQSYTKDILVYTGYQYEELRERDDCKSVLEQIAVLIDGRYEEEQNQGHVLRGSENQKIYYLRPEYEQAYETYIQANQGKHLAENFPAKEGVISVGIHKPDFRKVLGEEKE